MKKHFHSIIIVGLLCFVGRDLFAQKEPFIEGRGCGTMEYKAMEEKNDPSIKALREKLDAEARVFIENYQKKSMPHAVITIPVVFHIVYNGTAQNVSDACITAQLKRINDDYRKKNTDWTKVTQTGWNALVADCEIEFCLAVRDPSNNPTTGITRTSTSHAPFSYNGGSTSPNNDVKFTSRGGHDVWNRDKYFNIWICDLASGLLGYAQFPGGSAVTDGLVIDYKYMVGATGCGSAPYDLGRTATHELGHCFNLYHIWGDDGLGQGGVCSGTTTSQCDGSDNVSDTPNQCGCHYGTFSAGSVQTDICSGAAPGTMWMNYMDYTDDASMYMFTLGQKAALAATMAGPRAALKTSNGCSPLTGIEYFFSSESISVFPNPSTGDIALNINIPNISPVDITVYNALGETVLKKNSVPANSEAKLDMNNKPEGMYFIKISAPEGSVTKKVVINR